MQVVDIVAGILNVTSEKNVTLSVIVVREQEDAILKMIRINVLFTVVDRNKKEWLNVMKQVENCFLIRSIRIF
jgi:hypothetical protein